MNTTLWIVASVLALAFLFAGALTTVHGKEKLKSNGLAWVEGFPLGAVKTIGLLEILGAIGLILPALTGIAPVLVPLAATGIAVLMVGAALTHARRKEGSAIAVNVVLFALAAFVAWGRFGSYAF
ncbi:DoxX family protein [Glycomyces buryatensis]|uniref:DoxX family protein n=1 Tax=Glycomyces buryatensis TaxID=2570927 RepID=A0A4S8Q9T5_9ACTN|nr:DoxX family protein [Glycomyces buryatensis]THV41098.1 DoxX family protein [Glycomyces buryatensis]